MIEQENFRRIQLAESMRQTANQQAQLDSINQINRDLENVNQEVNDFRESYRKHSVMQEAEILNIIHNQSRQLFLTQQQINEMRNSANNVVQEQ